MNIKKFIAKEGLILLGFIGVSCLIMLFGSNANEQIFLIGLGVTWIGYPLYWLVKFILWAVKILKEEQD